MIYCCLLAVFVVAGHGGPPGGPSLNRGAVPCGQIEAYIKALGLQSAINGARQHGASAAEIQVTLRRCKIKASG